MALKDFGALPCSRMILSSGEEILKFDIKSFSIIFLPFLTSLQSKPLFPCAPNKLLLKNVKISEIDVIIFIIDIQCIKLGINMNERAYRAGRVYSKIEKLKQLANSLNGEYLETNNC